MQHVHLSNSLAQICISLYRPRAGLRRGKSTALIVDPTRLQRLSKTANIWALPRNLCQRGERNNTSLAAEMSRRRSAQVRVSFSACLDRRSNIVPQVHSQVYVSRAAIRRLLSLETRQTHTRQNVKHPGFAPDILPARRAQPHATCSRNVSWTSAAPQTLLSVDQTGRTHATFNLLSSFALTFRLAYQAFSSALGPNVGRRQNSYVGASPRMFFQRGERNTRATCSRRSLSWTSAAPRLRNLINVTKREASSSSRWLDTLTGTLAGLSSRCMSSGCTREVLAYVKRPSCACWLVPHLDHPDTLTGV